MMHKGLDSKIYFVESSCASILLNIHFYREGDGIRLNVTYLLTKCHISVLYIILND